jgi:hypothetical protein
MGGFSMYPLVQPEVMIPGILAISFAPLINSKIPGRRLAVSFPKRNMLRRFRLPRKAYRCFASGRTEKRPKGRFSSVRPEVIETSTYPWQGHVIPLNHGRNYSYAYNSFCTSSIHRLSFCFKRVLPIIVFPTPKCNVCFWLRPSIT